jgi:class 3 adenylate cyclase
MRQLVAIVFADMTGYTALMQETELLAKSLITRSKNTMARFCNIMVMGL